MNRQYRKSGANQEAGRTPRLLALALVLVTLTGCATKRDLRDLRSEVVALQIRQDSLFQILQVQNDLLMDSVSGNREFILSSRGEIARTMWQLMMSCRRFMRIERRAQTYGRQCASPMILA